MVSERDLRLDDGRTLRVYDSGGSEAAHAFTVVWHHGSPQTGALLEPLLSAAARRGVRLLSYGPPAMAAPALTRAGMWRRRLPTWRSSQTRSGFSGSR